MKQIDLFGVPFLVNLRGRDKTNSNCGFIFTLILITMSALMLIYFSDDMINRKNPIANRSEIKGSDLDDETLKIDFATFTIKFGLTSGEGFTYYINESVYTAKAQTFIGADYLDKSVAGCDNTQIFDLELQICTSKTGEGQLYCLGPKIPEAMKRCLKDKTQEDLFIIVNHQNIFIDFYKCTGFSYCKSLNEINEILQSGYWMIEHTDWVIDTQNYEKPLISFPKLERIGVIANLYKKLMINLGKLEFTSDDGWLLNSQTQQEFIYKETSEIDFFVQENNKFFRLSISSLGNKLLYSRKYDKIQNVIASVSSVFSVCFVIVGAIALPVAKLSMYETIVNDLFTVKIRSGSGNLSENKRNKSKKLSNKKKPPQKILTPKTIGNILCHE